MTQDVVVMKDDFGEYEDLKVSFPNSVLVVYKYTDDGYEGWGHLFALTEDNRVLGKTLGHCSCYGPLEGESDTTHTMEEFLALERSNLDGDEWEVRESFLAKVPNWGKK